MLNKKVICGITLLFLIVGNLVFYTNKVFAYATEPTHPNLAKEMIRLYNNYYDPDITDGEAKWILQGSIDEDTMPRYAFHLYDPIYDRAPFGVYTAKDWAINSDVQGNAFHKFANVLLNLFGKQEGEFKKHGDYSWTASINNYAKSKDKEAWYGLGHILHLIADMTVPAHSRDDHHVMGDPFESWIGKNLKSEDYIFADKLMPVELYSINQAFDDLAKYSNKYFFSKDSVVGTDLGNEYINPRIIKKEEYDFEKYRTRLYAMGKDENGKIFKLAETTRDILSGVETYSIKNDDYNIHLDYWKRLAPKAVEYGAGVIKLFIEDAEYEAQKLSNVKKPSSLAEILNSLINGSNTNDSVPERLPDIKPSRLPVALDVISNEPIETPSSSSGQAPIENPIEISVENPIEVPSTIINQDNNTNSGNGSIIVTGPKTGDEGGVSPRSNQNLESEPESEPEPEPEECFQTGPTTLSDHTVISENTTWTKCLSPYYLESNSNQWPIVEQGVTLTIEPGVVIMPQNANYTALEIRGTLKVEGMANDKIVFTSKNDADYNGAGGAISGDWSNIVFTSTSENSIMNYVLFKYGGKNDATIKIDGSYVEINNSIIQNSDKNGIYLKDSNSKITNTTIKNNNNDGIIVEGMGSAPKILNCEINNNLQYGIEIKDGTMPIIKNNSFSTNFAPIYSENSYFEITNNNASNNTYNGIMISSKTIINQNMTWNPDLVYILESNFGDYVTVNQGITLTLKPGIVIKPSNKYYNAMVIKGILKAEGILGNEIIFTSLKDDTFGGDTNNNGNATVPDIEDWKKIEFTSTSTNSILDYVKFLYGTGNPLIIDPSAGVEVKDTVTIGP